MTLTVLGGRSYQPGWLKPSGVLDYALRRLALDFLDTDTRRSLNMYSLEDEVQQLIEAWRPAPLSVGPDC
ncbi:MAG: hypothetical protein WAN20_21880 [Pseudonocardiaceae bacterium]